MSLSLSAIGEKPRRKSGLSWSGGENANHLFVLLAVLFCSSASMIVSDGCGSSAPRFRSSGPASGVPSGKPTIERKDSTSSDTGDVETSTPDAAKIGWGARSFKTEKNDAISGLDQAKMMREISKLMGVSYKLGGQDENGIDCSAYTLTIYRNALSRQLPRSSAEQFKSGAPVSYDDLKFGDLVFFNTTGETASHVGIYLGDDLFAHASVTLGVTISSLESMYFKNRYDGARRIVP